MAHRGISRGHDTIGSSVMYIPCLPRTFKVQTCEENADLGFLSLATHHGSSAFLSLLTSYPPS
jgi:predicted small integral membrane protein